MWSHYLGFSSSLPLLFLLLAVGSCQNGGGGGGMCEHGNIRLVNGRTRFEGRVEICIGDVWGTVCNDFWGVNDATVVCRQLGFSTESGASVALMRARLLFGSVSSGVPIHLDDVRCNGQEHQLITCQALPIGDHNCGHYEDAGVRCQPNAPLPGNVNITANSAVIPWRLPPNSSLPDSYNVTLSYRNNSLSQNHTAIIQVLGARTRVEFEGLLPLESYHYCVIAVYGASLLSFCRTFRTQNSTSITTTLAPPHPNPCPSTTPCSPSTFPNPTPCSPSYPSPTPCSPSTCSTPSTTLGCNPEAISDGHNSIVVGVLVSIIVVLLFLLLLAVLGLAYPRCIRSKVKDKKHFSRISRFLDEKVYLSQNNATSVSNSSNNRAGYLLNPTYDVIHDSPHTSHVTAVSVAPQVLEQNHVSTDNAAQHYEMHEANVMGGPTTSQDYEVAVTNRREEAPYSHLTHK